VRTMQSTVNETKFVELLVHAVHALSGQGRGMATKLNKLLYFCDFAHVRRPGDPITGFEYQKLPQGPAPRAMVPVRDRLLDDGTLTLRVENDAFGYNHHVYTTTRLADMTVFSDSERETIDNVVGELSSMSGRQVSDLSHEDAGWQMVDVGKTIPYATAYLGDTTELPDRLRNEIEAGAERITSELGPRLAG
jgi:hypothetical protein